MGNEPETVTTSPSSGRGVRWTWLLAGVFLFVLLVAAGLAAGTFPRLDRDRVSGSRPPRIRRGLRV